MMIIKPFERIKHNAMSFEWHAAPESVEPADRQVHIWKAALDDTYSCETSSVLCAEELQRSLRLISPQKRARFQCARAVLRNILSRYLRQPPESIQFGYGPQGKPFLLTPIEGKMLEFNISHSEGIMLAAITTCGPLGIDLESREAIQVAERVVASYFSKRDQEIFKSIPQDEKDDAFLEAWVMKEAYGKALGHGLAAASVRDHFAHISDTRLPPLGCEVFRDEEFCCLRFTPAPDFSAAVVIRTAQNPDFFFWETA